MSAAPADRPAAHRALVSASTDSYRIATLATAGLAILSGLISLAGIVNRRRVVAAQECPGGAICGASADLAGSGAA